MALLGQLVYEEISCCNCMMPFAVSGYVYKQLHESHDTFYCPAGHGQHFTGQSEAEKLKKELQSAKSDSAWYKGRAERLETDLDFEKRSRAAIKGNLTKLKKRIANGVCPCCHRNFANVQRHMSSQHPDFEATDGEMATE